MLYIKKQSNFSSRRAPIAQRNKEFFATSNYIKNIKKNQLHCDIILPVALPLSQRRGGDFKVDTHNFFLSVVANIVAYYICKWLDRY